MFFYHRVFFYNPSSKTSVWERPPDLIGRGDVTEMLKSQTAAEKMKKTVLPSFMTESSNNSNNANAGSKKGKKAGGGNEEEEPPQKKKKVELVFEDELKAKEGEASGGQFDCHPHF